MPDTISSSQKFKDQIIWHTITITGLVFIFFARAAYLKVFEVSDRLDLAGDTHAIYKIKINFYHN